MMNYTCKYSFESNGEQITVKYMNGDVKETIPFMGRLNDHTFRIVCDEYLKNEHNLSKAS
jgi:hypothetical protein